MVKNVLKRPEEKLAEIAADNSKLFKENYLRASALQQDDEFFKGLRLALDNFDTFGVKKVPERTGPDGPGVSMEVFEGLCEQLVARELTGNDAQNQIQTLMQHSTNTQWNGWYRRILTRDLKAGFSEATVNKAVKGVSSKYIIPVFSCQLAHDAKDDQHRLTGTKLIDIKLDGARVLSFIYPDGRVEHLSRNGKPLENFPLIRKELQALCSVIPEPIVIDGEMMSANFQDLMKQFRRKTNVDTNDSVYYVFDILTVAEFKTGKGKLGQKLRRTILEALIDENQDAIPHTTAVAYEEINFDTERGRAKFNEINKMATEINPATGKPRYEGVMVKDPVARYECKRTWAWMKLKPKITVTLPIKEVKEGKPGTKYVGMLGAFECSGCDGDDPRHVDVNVGTGYTDEMRAAFWKIRAQFPGVLIDIESDGYTQDQHGNWSLRFPTFKTFRGFTPGEKI